MSDILSDDERRQVWLDHGCDDGDFEGFARAVERAVVSRLAAMGGELPPKRVVDRHLPTGVALHAYDADQLRAERAKGVAAGMAQERARCAAACVAQASRWLTSPRDIYVVHECVAAINGGTLAPPPTPVDPMPPFYAATTDTVRAHYARGVAAGMAQAAPSEPQYPLPDDLYDSKDWRSGSYAERVEWLHTMYEGTKKTLDTYLEMRAAPSAEPIDGVSACAMCGRNVEPGSEPVAMSAPSAEPVAVIVERGRVWIERGNQRWMLAYDDDEPHAVEWYAQTLRKALTPPALTDGAVEAMRKHVEAFARQGGWTPDDGEGAFEFVQRTSYRQGWEDGRQEATDPHRDAPSEPVGEVVAIDVDDEGGAEAVIALHREPSLGDMLYAAPPAPPAEPSEPVAFHNPWRESLENCISGDNYLRASEYQSLIEELDDLYRLRAAHPAPAEPTDECTTCGAIVLGVQGVTYGGPNPPAWPDGAREAMDKAFWAMLAGLSPVEDGRPHHIVMQYKAAIDALRAQIEQIGGGR